MPPCHGRADSARSREHGVPPVRAHRGSLTTCVVCVSCSIASHCSLTSVPASPPPSSPCLFGILAGTRACRHSLLRRRCSARTATACWTLRSCDDPGGGTSSPPPLQVFYITASASLCPNHPAWWYPAQNLSHVFKLTVKHEESLQGLTEAQQQQHAVQPSELKQQQHHRFLDDRLPAPFLGGALPRRRSRSSLSFALHRSTGNGVVRGHLRGILPGGEHLSTAHSLVCLEVGHQRVGLERVHRVPVHNFLARQWPSQDFAPRAQPIACSKCGGATAPQGKHNERGVNQQQCQARLSAYLCVYRRYETGSVPRFPPPRRAAAAPPLPLLPAAAPVEQQRRRQSACALPVPDAHSTSWGRSNMPSLARRSAGRQGLERRDAAGRNQWPQRCSRPLPVASGHSSPR